MLKHTIIIFTIIFCLAQPTYSQGLSSHKIDTFLFVNSDCISRNIISKSASSIITVIDNEFSLNQPFRANILEYNLLSGGYDRTDITSQLPKNMKFVDLACLGDNKFIYGAIANEVDSIWIGSVSDSNQLTKTLDFTLTDLFDDSYDILYLSSNILDSSHILISGSVVLGPNKIPYIFLIEIDITTMTIERSSSLLSGRPIRDAILISDTIFFNDLDLYYLAPGENLVKEMVSPGGYSKVRWQTNIESTSSQIYACGQIGDPFEFRRGNLLVKMNSDRSIMAVDSIFLTQTNDSTTYGAHQSLKVIEDKNLVVHSGTTNIVLNRGIPFNSETSFIYLSVLDTNLNPVAFKTFGGDAFYYNTFTRVFGDDIVLTGLRYDSELDEMVGFVKIYSLNQLVSNASEPPVENALNLYPNPATDHLTVDIPDYQGLIRYQVFSMSGQRMFSGISQNESSIDIGSLASGNYVLRLLDGESRGYSQVFLKH